MSKSDANLADIAYHTILKKIVTLEIRPGDFLQERTLAEQLNMSRTPVREALNRLAQEFWVKINARRNIEVKQLDVQDIRSLFAVRRTLEGRGIDYIVDNKLCREASTKLQAALAQMERHSLNDYEFNKADIEFHEILALADNNRYLTEFWKRIVLENARMGLVAFEFFEKNTEKICLEHMHILHGIQKQSKRLAMAALTNHLDGVMHAILAFMQLKAPEAAPREDDIYHAIYAQRRAPDGQR